MTPIFANTYIISVTRRFFRLSKCYFYFLEGSKIRKYDFILFNLLLLLFIGTIHQSTSVEVNPTDYTMLPPIDSEIDYTIDYIEINNVSNLTSHPIVSDEIAGFLKIFDYKPKLQPGDAIDYSVSDLNTTCITFSKRYTYNSEEPVMFVVGSDYQYLNHLAISNIIMTSNENLIQSYVSTNNDVLSVGPVNATENTTFVLDYTEDSIDYDVEVVFCKGWIIDLNFSIYNHTSMEILAKCLLAADDISNLNFVAYSDKISFDRLADFSLFTIGLTIGDNYEVKMTKNTNYDPSFEEGSIFNLTVITIEPDSLTLSVRIIYPNGTQTDAIESTSKFSSYYIPFFFTTTNIWLIETLTPYYWNLTITEHTIEFQLSIDDHPLTDTDSEYYYKYAKATGWLLEMHIITRDSNTSEILQEYQLTTLNYELPQDNTTTTTITTTTTSTGHSTGTTTNPTSFSLPPLAALAILLIGIKKRQEKEL